jgi:D-3-phosphoglycerate dehydrogenase
MPLPLEGVRAMLGPVAERVDLSVPASRDWPDVAAAVADAEIVFASWQGTHPLPFDRRLVAACGPALAFVQQPSVGVDSLDLPALAERGVPVSNTAGANASAVAQWCIAAALALARSLVWADGQVRQGAWPQIEIAARYSVELDALRAGIVGFGPIGQECARLLTAFGCNVSYWSRSRRPTTLEHGATYRELDELLAASDLVVCVLPLTDSTRGLLDAGRLALLPREALVVDAGRGGVIDPDALVAAIESGALGGAALDVYETEPLPVDSPLRRSDRILLSPHTAGSTRQSQMRMIGVAVDNIRRVLDGEPVLHVVNGVSPVVTRRAAGP